MSGYYLCCEAAPNGGRKDKTRGKEQRHDGKRAHVFCVFGRERPVRRDMIHDLFDGCVQGLNGQGQQRKHRHRHDPEEGRAQDQQKPKPERRRQKLMAKGCFAPEAEKALGRIARRGKEMGYACDFFGDGVLL